MAESKESFQEKTEQPTPKRQSEARKKGQVAKSMEINSAVILLTGLVVLTIWGGTMFSRMIATESFIFSQVGQIELTPDVLPGYLLSGAKTMLNVLIPVMLPIVLVGIAVNVLQFGFVFSLQSIKPKLDKLNPIKGLQRLFSRKSLVELVKSVLKVAIVGWVGYITIAGLSDEMVPLMDQGIWAIYLWVCKSTATIGFRTVLVIMILAFMDLIYQRWEHTQQMKMTKQEVKDEQRQAEGDPKVKSKMRSIQFKTALQRMMKEIPTADVVITNPTEVAVALAYDAEQMRAPTMVAKGKRLIAQRIREIAIEHDIPLMENPPLARDLYKAVEVGQEIPGNFYQAVAEILAYVYNLRSEDEVVSRSDPS